MKVLLDTHAFLWLIQGDARLSREAEAVFLEADNEPFLGLQAWPKFDFDITDEMPLSHCDVAITPACIRAMYNFTQATSAVPNNELGIFEDIGDIYSQEDLD